MSLVKPITNNFKESPSSIENIPPLIIGGAVFNTQYSDDPESLPLTEILRIALKNGLNAIDTSPYYGPSEIILGNSLREISNEWRRESYFISTKAGRVKLNEFDYSRSSIRKSVERSLQRLNTNYLDLVYLHDIEFVEKDQILEALKELKLLRNEGSIRYIGISGYPVKFLYEIALKCVKDPEIGSLDAILSYSNGCLQNTILLDYYEKFFENCGIKKLMNGSILSMSLLRSQSTLGFHPARQELKDKVQEVANYLKENYNGLELADLSTRFALRKWLFETKEQTGDKTDLEWNTHTSVVLGVSNVEELNAAISNYWQVKSNVKNINEQDEPIFEKVKELLGSHYNETWESGLPGRG